MSFALRRRLMSGGFILMFILIATATAFVAYAADQSASPGPHSIPIPAFSLASVKRVPAQPVSLATARSVPVLVYHEMNNDCAPAAPVCHSHDYESVSTAQFTAEIAWLHSHGYHTVTLPQYLRWTRNRHTRLPVKPFLITVDNGIGDFLEGAQPILYQYRYTATAFIVTGFADGAAGACSPLLDKVDVQPECPMGDVGWDLTWPQLRALSPAVYGFGIEAGADGHYLQDYDPKCTAFSACLLPHESGTAYEKRVRNEYSRGIAELKKELGKRFDSSAWVVPYSDLGYDCSKRDGCAYERYDGPAGWLISYAATAFHVAFVQDAYRNGIRNERFRYEIHALTTLPGFTATIQHYTVAGSWNWR
jgi:peptidoglycan/xylan/chitin deacetylase (PgdA/CDA1 family)